MLTPAQIRGARGMLRISQIELAEMAGISHTGLANIENETSDPRASTLAAIQRALEAAGVAFTNGGQPGIKMANALEIWQRVVFREDHKVIGMTAILKALIPAYAEAGYPEAAKVWHKATGAGDHIYFFSPIAAALIPGELKEANALPAPLPNLKVGFKQVPLAR